MIKRYGIITVNGIPGDLNGDVVISGGGGGDITISQAMETDKASTTLVGSVNAVYDWVMSKDVTNMKLTGSQSFTGIKSSTNTTGTTTNGFVLYQTAGNGSPLTINNTSSSGSSGIEINQTSGGQGIFIYQNTGLGTNIFNSTASNTSHYVDINGLNSIGLQINTSGSSGVNKKHILLQDNTTSFTGTMLRIEHGGSNSPLSFPFSFASGGVVKSSLDYLGNFSAASFINPSVPETNILLAGGGTITQISLPISSTTQTALDLKANLANPTFTGTPRVPTSPPGTNTLQAASTAFVVSAIANAGINYVTLGTNQTISGLKTFNSKITITGSNNHLGFSDADSLVNGAYISPVIGNYLGCFAIAGSGNQGGAYRIATPPEDGVYKIVTLPSVSGTLALLNNSTSLIATSFINQSAPPTNILLAGGTDITQLSLPISTANQTALNLKVDKVGGKSLVNDTDITKITSAVQPNVNTVFTSVNSNAIVLLTYTANALNWTGLESNLIKIILTKDSVLSNPTSPVTNTIYQFIVEQDSIGLWTLTYGNKFKFPNGTVPVIDLNANSRGILTSIYDGTYFLTVSAQNFQ